MKKQFKHYIIVPSLCHSRADGNPGKITDGYRFRPNFLTSKASSENGSALVVQRYDREDGLLPARNAISLQAGVVKTSRLTEEMDSGLRRNDRGEKVSKSFSQRKNGND